MFDSKSRLATLFRFAIAVLPILTACGTPTDLPSQTQVTNGISIGASKYPSVVLLGIELEHGEAFCTGTFVNDSQVVSAGHCVEGLEKTHPRIYLATLEDGHLKTTTQALSWAREPGYDISQGVAPNDLSIITFPARTSSSISRIASEHPRAGDAFTIIGFGNNVNYENNTGEGMGAGKKRSGTNTILAVEDGMIEFLGLTGEEKHIKRGTDVSSGEGDSGGPLFIKGKIAGITSGGGLQSKDDGTYEDVSLYVDLTSPQSQTFLAKNLKENKSSL